MMFNQPTGQARYLKPAETNGHLILVTKYVGVEQVQDKFRGLCDQLEVDLVDLDEGGPGTPLAHRTLIKHPAIISAVEKAGFTLGRIGQRKAQATGNDYWTILPYEPADAERAQEWVAEYHFDPATEAPAAPAPKPAGTALNLDDMRRINEDRQAKLAAVSASGSGDDSPPF